MNYKKVLIMFIVILVSTVTVYGKTYDFAKDGPIATTKLIKESELPNVIINNVKLVPQNPMVKPYKKNRLILKWDKVNEADGYVIYQKHKKSKFKEVYRTKNNKYISPGLKNNTTYYFKVAVIKDNEILDGSYWVSGQTNNKMSKYENATIDTISPYDRDGGFTVKTGNPKVVLSILNIKNKNYESTYWKNTPFDVYVRTKKKPVSKLLRIENRSSNIIKLGMVTKDYYQNNKCFKSQFDRLNGICIKDVLSYKYGNHKPGQVLEIDVIAHNGYKITIRYLLAINNYDNALRMNPNTYIKNFKKYGCDEYKIKPDVININ
ncbi:MAG: fibronectin type III domain-containing protein [Anaerovoracaceae bacterium]